ncbi:NAD-dependent 4,6-dehydratase LegB [Geothermobacter hydrogeniphilus]|uniref:NAD-dependent dehydratase n=1 Tax=Geothermobacter hydrogeniphilus TaxID=1969733 RepID=A0A1X0YEF4_9BACT|nr:NAD-dependent 4,6-dehydratase LegB [Geothermobacter hydrogeniphilus]ORJ63489.1 NAD-dependent dehydratase [Geothermobacter hydrogeniphilus]
MKGKQVLVTGADGFIGSHLTEQLVRQGARVRALSLYNSFNHWGWLESTDILDQVEVVCGDIRDPFFCKKITAGIDTVFHLAALIAIPYSYQAPASYIETNVNGTLNICQAALENGCRRMIQTSTSEVYGTARYVPIDENHPLQPQSPYSASKIGADAIAESYHRAFDLPLTIARPFNTYGPRQSARAVIPGIISQIAEGQPELRLGDLTPTRDFTFVDDTCRGLRALAASEATLGETVNIGSNDEISIGELARLIRDMMGSSITIVSDEQRLRPEKSEVFRLRCDNSKLRELTGFVPETSLKKGLERTIAWFTDERNLARYKGGIYNV